MVEAAEIMTAINRLLLTIYPEDMVYIDECPKDFERPGFLIEKVTESINRVSFRVVEVEDYYTVVCFETVNERYDSDSVKLMERQRAVINLFRKGYIRAGDRALKVYASSGGRDDNEAYVDIQFRYFDDVGGKQQQETAELMQAVNIIFRE